MPKLVNPITANGDYYITFPNLGNSRIGIGVEVVSGTGTLTLERMRKSGNNEAIAGGVFTASGDIEVNGDGAVGINVAVTSASSLVAHVYAVPLS